MFDAGASDDGIVFSKGGDGSRQTFQGEPSR
jgi:hypothetical protein